jgi:hypothetical protein
MSHLSDSCCSVIVVALVERRQVLQGRAAFWAGQPPEQLVRGEPSAAFAARANATLAAVETAIRELESRTIPWLRCHPDLKDFFLAKQAAGPLAEVE